MNLWVTIGVQVAMGLLVVGVGFYVRFYPDVNTQKRHLKLFGLAVWILATVGFQVLSIYKIAHSGKPVTPDFVVEVASDFGALIFNLVIIYSLLFLRALGLFVNLYRTNSETDNELRGRMIGIAEKHLAAIQRSADAIVVLATQPGIDPETAGRVRALMTNLYTPK